jgi:3-oxoacyl-[acyl-carrier protein] reductase
MQVPSPPLPYDLSGHVALITGANLGIGVAKAALENYTMSAAFELAPYGITANIVYPPVTDTGWENDAVREHVKTRSELLHIVRPEEEAEIIPFLASDHARLITANIVHLR